MSTMPAMPLTPGMRIQFEAINSTTGVAVSGVTVSLATLYVEGTTDDDDTGTAAALPPFQYVGHA